MATISVKVKDLKMMLMTIETLKSIIENILKMTRGFISGKYGNYKNNHTKMETPELKNEPIPVVEEPKNERLTNSDTAKRGIRAEVLLTEAPDIWDHMSNQYFGKQIDRIERIKGRFKSDIVIIFKDGTEVNCQVKNGTGGGRGWSFDRRQASDLPTSIETKNQIKAVCLREGGDRTDTPLDQMLIKRLLLGERVDKMPYYFIHTTLVNNKIVKISICSMPLFVKSILKESYEKCLSKITCVHLTPRIYLQRKGGGSKDHSPNDIQAKLKSMPECMTDIKI